MTRTVVCGGPRTGKTRHSATLGGTVLHTDDLIGTLPWGGDNGDSVEVAKWMDAPGGWTIEGITAVRGLRRWLASHPTGKPCDVVVWMDVPKVAVTPKQVALGKGCATVFAEIRGELVRRGVRVEER